MNRHKPFRKLQISFLGLGAVLLSSPWNWDASPLPQQESQQARSQQEPPPPPQNSRPASQQTPPPDQPGAKKHKVWTNDDLVLLRTPADTYQLEKEAKEAAEAESAAKEAAISAAIKSEKQPPLNIQLPATPEETEKMLKSTQGDIQEEAFVLDKLKKELLDAPTEQQAEKQKEIDRLTASLEILRRDEKALQEHLETLRGKSQGTNPPAAPQPPSL